MSIKQRKKDAFSRVDELRKKINDEKYIKDVIQKMANDIIEMFIVQRYCNKEV